MATLSEAVILPVKLSADAVLRAPVLVPVMLTSPPVALTAVVDCTALPLTELPLMSTFLPVTVDALAR